MPAGVGNSDIEVWWRGHRLNARYCAVSGSGAAVPRDEGRRTGRLHASCQPIGSAAQHYRRQKRVRRGYAGEDPAVGVPMPDFSRGCPPCRPPVTTLLAGTGFSVGLCAVRYAWVRALTPFLRPKRSPAATRPPYLPPHDGRPSDLATESWRCHAITKSFSHIVGNSLSMLGSNLGRAQRTGTPRGAVDPLESGH